MRSIAFAVIAVIPVLTLYGFRFGQFFRKWDTVDEPADGRGRESKVQSLKHLQDGAPKATVAHRYTMNHPHLTPSNKPHTLHCASNMQVELLGKASCMTEFSCMSHARRALLAEREKIAAKTSAADTLSLTDSREVRPEMEERPAVWGVELVTMLLQESLEVSPDLARRSVEKLCATLDKCDPGGLDENPDVTALEAVLSSVLDVKPGGEVIPPELVLQALLGISVAQGSLTKLLSITRKLLFCPVRTAVSIPKGFSTVFRENFWRNHNSKPGLVTQISQECLLASEPFRMGGVSNQSCLRAGSLAPCNAHNSE